MPRFLAAVRILSFLSAVSCRYVCCYCYWGKKSQCWRPDNYKWGLYTQYCSYIRYIAAVFCVIGTCLAGRALCKAVSWQVCFPFIIKWETSWQEFQLEFHWRKFIWGFCSNLVRKLKLSSQDSAPRSLASVTVDFITFLSLKACRWPHIRCPDNIIFLHALRIRVSIQERFLCWCFCKSVIWQSNVDYTDINPPQEF